MHKVRISSGLLSGVINALLLWYSVFLYAEVSLDGSVGAQGALPGPHYEIPAEVGEQVGNNLFHSFERFSIGSEETATFSGPAQISNIISRVTGGQLSTIDGTVESTIPSADFYFINPAGIVFGQQAQLNIDGSFYISTADELRLGEQGRFGALATRQTVLTAAPPEAFGFLDETHSEIKLQGSTLSARAGNTMTFVAAGVQLERAQLRNPGGTIRLATQAQLGQVSTMAQAPIKDEIATNTGTISLRNNSRMLVDGASSGTVVIRAGQLHLQGSGISAHATDTIGSAPVAVDIQLRETLSMTENSSISSGLQAQRGATVRAGDVAILADEINLTERSAVRSWSNQGAPGDISIQAARVRLESGAIVETSTIADLPVEGGNITIQADTLALLGEQQQELLSLFPTGIITGAVLQGDQGAAGDIHLEVANTVTIQAGAHVQSRGWQRGASGKIGVAAATLSIGGGSTLGSIGVIDAVPGGIDIHTQRLHLRDGGKIGSLNFGANAERAPGAVVVESEVALLIENQVEAASSAAQADASLTRILPNIPGTAAVQRLTGLVSLTTAKGFGADVDLRSPMLVLDNGFVGTVAASTGPAGNIEIDADTLRLQRKGLIISGANGAGHTGTITVTGHELTAHDTGSILSLTNGKGQARAVQLDIRDSINVTSEGKVQSIFGTFTIGAGAAGDTIVKSDLIRLKGGVISSLSQGGSGNAGSVDVRARQIVLDAAQSDRTGIDSSSLGGSTGNAGTTFVQADDLTILNNARINSESGGSGDAGMVTVETKRLRITDAERSSHNDNFVTGISTSTVNSGAGGAIHLTVAEQLSIDANASGRLVGIYASSIGSGDAGSIVVNAATAAIELIDGGSITTSVFASGNAGSVDVVAEDITISGSQWLDLTLLAREPVVQPAGIASSAETGATGGGGTVTVAARQLKVLDGGGILTRSLSPSTAGDVEITAQQLQLDGAVISSSAASANGGNILLHVADRLHLKDAKITTSVLFDRGHGGNILIDGRPAIVIFDNASILANAVGGDGGGIAIQVGQFIATPTSNIQAHSQFGFDGELQVDTLPSSVAEHLIPWMPAYADVAEVIPQPCKLMADSGTIRFVHKRYDVAPSAPQYLQTGMPEVLLRNMVISNPLPPRRFQPSDHALAMHCF